MKLRLFYLCIYIVEAAIAAQYFGKMFLPKRKKTLMMTYIAVGYFILFLLSGIEDAILNAFAFMFINVCLLKTCYQVNFMNVCFHALIMTTSSGLVELCTGGLLGIFSSGFSIDENYLADMIWLAVISKLLYYVLLRLVIFLFGSLKNRKQLSGRGNGILLLVPVSSFFLMQGLVYVCIKIHLSKQMELLLALSGFLLLILNVAMYAIYDRDQKSSVRLSETQLRVQKEHAQAQYYQKLLQQDEQQRIMLHDTFKHMQSIDLLLENGKTEQAAAYIRQIYETQQFREKIRFSDNKMLNLILNRYLTLCENAHIKFYIDIHGACMDFMTMVDITALFCNLLDNALEAAEKAEEGYVDLWIRNRQDGSGLVITMENSCVSRQEKAGWAIFQTNKKDKARHGYGMKSIAGVLQKYHGEIEAIYKEKQHEFHTTIILYEQNETNS